MSFSDPPRFDPYPLWQYYPLRQNIATGPIAAGEPVQDGLLQYFNAIAPQADANVERRLETEPYEWPHFNKS